ncbi:MAG: hypothetical protein LBR34_02210 [Prevotella sp.]|nr:hypothetical protein [Prevotella sp.]
MKHLAIILPLVLTGCTRTVYVPAETVRTEFRNTLSRDSVFVLDSVFVRTAGDTTELERYRYVYRNKELVDTLMLSDTIRIPYPVETVRNINALKNWQIGLMLIGAAALAAGLSWIYQRLK